MYRLNIIIYIIVINLYILCENRKIIYKKSRGNRGRNKKLLITSDGIKENLKEVIERLKEYGLKVYMFIGDKKEVANYIGKSLNIFSYIKSEMLPTDKYDNYEYVSNKDGLTIFVGDGVNDALY